MINTNYNAVKSRQKFGCKVLIDKDAQEILAKNMKRLHEIPQTNDLFFNNSKTVNPVEKLDFFKNVMETVTNGIDGILHYKAPNGKVVLHYETADKTFESPYTYNAAEMLSMNNSKDSPEKQIATYNLARLSDILTDNKVEKDKNPFHKLYDFYTKF